MSTPRTIDDVLADARSRIARVEAVDVPAELADGAVLGAPAPAPPPPAAAP